MKLFKAFAQIEILALDKEKWHGTPRTFTLLVGQTQRELNSHK